MATSHLSTISVYPSADVCEVLASPNSQISWVGGLSLWFCSVFINVETDHGMHIDGARRIFGGILGNFSVCAIL